MVFRNCFVGHTVLFFFILLLVVSSFYPVEGVAMAAGKKLRICIIPHRSHIGNEQAYTPFAEALEEATGLSVAWVGSKSYADVIENLRTGRVDIAYLGPFSYVDAQDGFGVRFIVRTLNKRKEAFYHSMIVTRKDSGLKSLNELKGKRFAFTDPKSTSGFLFPMAGLLKNGMRLEDFSSVEYLKRHANSLLAVYNGHVDAGAISSTATDKVDLDFDRIRIVWKSAPIYRGPWVARKTLPDALFGKVREAFLFIGGGEAGDRIFEGLGTRGFVEGRDADYDNVRELKRLLGLP